MFKSRVAARIACLRAGVDSTHPLQVSAINRGWNPDAAELPGLVSVGNPVDSIVLDDKIMQKLTMGATYGKIAKD